MQIARRRDGAICVVVTERGLIRRCGADGAFYLGGPIKQIIVITTCHDPIRVFRIHHSTQIVIKLSKHRVIECIFHLRHVSKRLRHAPQLNRIGACLCLAIGRPKTVRVEHFRGIAARVNCFHDIPGDVVLGIGGD